MARELHEFSAATFGIERMSASAGPVRPTIAAEHRSADGGVGAAVGGAMGDATVAAPGQLHQYTMVQKIGQGTYGEVYKATVEDKTTGEGWSSSPFSPSLSCTSPTTFACVPQ